MLDLPVDWNLYRTGVEIVVLYVPGCPHRALARSRIDVAIGRVQRPAVVRERPVGSTAAAIRAGMRGSPTILVDGRDPFADGADAASLACRLYRGGDGPSGAPTVEQLVAAFGG